MLNIPSEVKTLLQNDGTLKNIRITFPNGERNDILSDSIVQNSVNFSESLCSRNEIKFGLCESSIFECEVVDIENIKGMSIYCQMEIDCSSLGEEWCSDNAQTSEDVDFPFYVIPFGLFAVDSCQKQADMSHRKIVAYSIEFPKQVSKDITDIIAFQFKFEGVSVPTYTYDAAELAIASTNCGYCEEFEYSDFVMTEDSSRYVMYAKYDAVENLTYKVGFVGWHCDVYFGYEFNKGGLIYTEATGLNVDKEELKEIYDRVISIRFGDKLSYSAFERMCSKIIYLDWYEEKPDGLYGIEEKYIGTNNNYHYIRAVKDKGNNKLTQTIIIPHTWYYWVENEYGSIVYRIDKKIRDTYGRDFPPKPNEVKFMNVTLPIKAEKTVAKTFDSLGNAQVDLAEYLSDFEASIEMAGMFGKFTRDGKFTLIAPSSIANLYPSETLYPSESLFPQGMKGYSVPSTYSSAWFDDELSLPYGRVQAEYMSVDNSIYLAYVDIVTDYEDNPNAYQLYDISKNNIIKSSKYTLSGISEILNAIASKIANIRYMPCSINSIGMPWLEAGDTIALETTDGDIIKTIILSRKLNGERYMTDNFVSN